MANKALAAKTTDTKKENPAFHIQKVEHSPSSCSPVERILFLHRTIGNQAVQKLMKSGKLQAKLRIGAPGDIYEQEADRVAEQVMRMPEPEALKNTTVSGQAHGTLIQRRCPKCTDRRQEEDEEVLQPKEVSGSTPEVAPELETDINAVRGSGQPLPEPVRTFFEQRFRQDFSGVRVHADARAAEAARAVDARAFTVGKDVVFGDGEYAPARKIGQKLLAHELTHVIQQDKTPVIQFQKNVDDKKEGATAEVWNFDPNNLLNDTRLNPEFATAAIGALQAAVQAGLRPKVHEAYRSIERSDELYKKYKAGGPRAAPGWTSLHNYGLAMDLWLYDAKDSYISNNTKGWYLQYKSLAAYVKAYKFEWGEPINDADHFEYHPKWKGLVGGAILQRTRIWAMNIAKAVDAEAKASVSDWMQYFWWAAGAGGLEPVSKATDEL